MSAIAALRRHARHHGWSITTISHRSESYARDGQPANLEVTHDPGAGEVLAGVYREYDGQHLILEIHITQPEDDNKVALLAEVLRTRGSRATPGTSSKAMSVGIRDAAGHADRGPTYVSARLAEQAHDNIRTTPNLP